ncbi:TolC family outer membrane protein [Pistricoccus aurantiacus]|uniref:TolC family outer membrane protein n=1 Tax=Pistricoccus aurantiacus TaxID=1883414 RepID=UPI00362F4242
MNINHCRILASRASKYWRRVFSLGSTALLLPCSAIAQETLPPDTASYGSADLTAVVERAIASNPEVQAAWHAFQAAGHDTEIARGGYLPRVDVNAGVGLENRSDDDRGSYDTDYAELSLRQMIYDGFATRSQVEKLDRAELVRYYELLGTSENTALEAARAYLDVKRHRDLVKLGRDNYERHRRVYRQIDERTRSGAGRGVDLQQIQGRLALAESNLLTEASNLHDVSARYQRLIGELPPATLAEAPDFEARLPKDVSQALIMAYEGSPDFHAAIEDIAASRAEREAARSRFHPRLDLVARTGTYQGEDYSGDFIEDDGRESRSSIGLVASMNLYRGGSDLASFRAASDRVEQAVSLRRKACVDLRQTTQIAYNDTRRLREQLAYLNNHRQSTDRVRGAYRQQFDIGQRSLLDLLDIENEYFEASRVHVNARYNVSLADARTLAAMGRLLQVLDLRRDDLPTLAELGSDGVEIDPETVCPPTGARQYSLDDLIASDTSSLDPFPVD